MPPWQVRGEALRALLFVLPAFLLPVFLLPALALIAPSGASAIRAAPQTPPPSDIEPACGYNSQVADLLDQATLESYTGWIRQLAGEEDVLVNGRPARIQTRYSPTLFDGSSLAYEYVRELVSAWYPGQVEEHSYPAPSGYGGTTWKNLVLTIPGSRYPAQSVLLTAHLDSYSLYEVNGLRIAPGADDNASGAAALLEAARILRGQSFPRTLRLVWFTGEEQGKYGSWNYTARSPLTGVEGVVNVDMIGYDGDNDRCFELHVGTLPPSQTVGGCFARAIEAYNLDLTYDYLTTQATTRSDHAPFWFHGIGAVEVLENESAHQQPNGCLGADRNPSYHTEKDTLANMHPAYAFMVSRAALAAAFSLANPPPTQLFFMPAMLKSE